MTDQAELMPCRRWRVFNDGPRRWVLVDQESDEPCPVYNTRSQARAIAAQNNREAGQDDEG